MLSALRRTDGLGTRLPEMGSRIDLIVLTPGAPLRGPGLSPTLGLYTKLTNDKIHMRYYPREHEDSLTPAKVV